MATKGGEEQAGGAARGGPAGRPGYGEEGGQDGGPRGAQRGGGSGRRLYTPGEGAGQPRAGGWSSCRLQSASTGAGGQGPYVPPLLRLPLALSPPMRGRPPLQENPAPGHQVTSLM